MPIVDATPGPRLVGVPRPLVTQALGRPLTRRLVVTDVGCYPNASGHRTLRSRGIAENIVILCTRGVGWLRIGEETHRVGARDVLVVPAATPHEYAADDAEPWTIWWLHLNGSDAAEVVESTGATLNRPVVAIGDVDRTVALMDEIATTLERDPTPAKMLSATGAAWKLITLIAADRLMPRPGDPLQQAMTYLEDHLDRHITVPDLAARVGLSPSHLTAMFHRATGGGVLAHQVTLRMARARQLLDLTDAAIGEVAQRIGYSDAFYFSRQFRRHHGMSPTAYRARDAAG